MWGLSYWVFPLLAACVWLSMLLAMLIHWLTQGKPIYPSMDAGQKIAYISDVGAFSFKPLFIAMAAVTVVLFDIGILSERWLRHRGRLEHNTSTSQKVLSVLGFVFGVIGAAGLIFLSIFNTYQYPTTHDALLVVFIAGYVLSAIFITWEYGSLGRHVKNHPILRASFWIKLAFIVVEVALAIAFGVEQHKGGSNVNISAVLEWVIALVFTGYVLTFFMDLVPAVHTKHHQSRETEIEQAMSEVDGRAGGAAAYSSDSRYGLTQDGAADGNKYPNGQANGYTNGDANGNANGSANGVVNGHVHPHTTGIHDGTYYPDGHPPASRPVAASQNV